MKKILIINPFGIGDVLFTTPLIANIIQAFPDVYIGFVCNARAKEVLSSNPAISRVFVFERDYYRTLWKRNPWRCLKEFFYFLNDIRREQYDLALDISLGREYSAWMMCVGIKQRWGFSYKNRGLFLTKKIPLSGYVDKHVAEYYLELMHLFGVSPVKYALSMPLAASDLEWARQWIREQELEGKKLVAIVPGGGASWGKDRARKQWPPEAYTEVASRLISSEVRVILCGDAQDRALCDMILSRLENKGISLCGKTSLGQFAALCRYCKLAICNDGGCLHIAVAQGVRTLALFGPVDDKVYGPYPRHHHEVITADSACRPCYQNFKYQTCDTHQCLRDIPWQKVYEKAIKML